MDLNEVKIALFVTANLKAILCGMVFTVFAKTKKESRNFPRPYSTSYQTEHMEHMNWQLRVGGLCWLIKTLRWLVYGGTDVIPGSEAWIPGLVKDVENLYQEMV
ncbi:hypothetical protein [Paenibacillus sp. OAS669]|uniref:hypothetical protein n=1 Tax=Paenibacillus sp. OAS669 TaxID=2663821 RepID=UPI00178B190C|nr:hypothetical protein [Paenibacillus sp. OAS669]MBE1442588.1 hypothetical protein [Paenibacillus sp. OAS669]